MNFQVLFAMLLLKGTASKQPYLNDTGVRFHPYIIPMALRYGLPLYELPKYSKQLNDTKTRRIPMLTTTFEKYDTEEPFNNPNDSENTTGTETETKNKSQYLKIDPNQTLVDETEVNNYCGVANLVGKVPNIADIEDFPWLGVLIYPEGCQLLTTPVVLVTRELVITSATDLNHLPKDLFRERAKVTLGHDCNGPPIGVLTYTYHPDYRESTTSAVALVQLNISYVEQNLHPICPPPKHYVDPKIYALVLPNDCKKSKFQIYEMDYVPLDDCKTFYKNIGLDVEGIWPVQLVCARSPSEHECLWRSGVPLVLYQQNRWHLMGFGIPGPGCGAVSRFVDYGQSERWVRDSHLRIGQPAVTKLAPNYIVLRRHRTHLQRFGVCDLEEMKTEIYSDTMHIKPPVHILFRPGRIRYNLTLLGNVDYSCIIFKAVYDNRMAIQKTPQIILTRYCLSPIPLCYEPNLLEITFNLVVYYYDSFYYTMHAYGKEWKSIDTKAMISYSNKKRMFPIVPIFKGSTRLI